MMSQILSFAEARAFSEGLFEGNSKFRICSPYRPARAADSLDNDVEICRNSIRRRHLEASSRVREIADRTIKLRRLLAQNNLRCLEDAFAEDGSFVLHSPTPGIACTLK